LQIISFVKATNALVSRAFRNLRDTQTGGIAHARANKTSRCRRDPKLYRASINIYVENTAFSGAAQKRPAHPRINNYYRHESRAERGGACVCVCSLFRVSAKKGNEKIFTHTTRAINPVAFPLVVVLSRVFFLFFFFLLSEQSSPNCLILALSSCPGKIIRHLDGNVVREALSNKTNTPSLSIASACPGCQARCYFYVIASSDVTLILIFLDVGLILRWIAPRLI